MESRGSVGWKEEVERGGTALWLGACLLIVASASSVLAQGSIAAWGIQVAIEPAQLENLVAVAGGKYHSLGLKADGSIVA